MADERCRDFFFLAVLLRALRKDAQRPLSRSIASFLIAVIAVHVGAEPNSSGMSLLSTSPNDLATSYLLTLRPLYNDELL